MATFLVTGATGLIGRQFTRLLLTRDDVDKVALVVRASSRDKLAKLVNAWPHPERVTLVTGDLGEPLLGVGEEDREKLRGVDHVVHLAALYDLTADDEASIKANVEGTAQVIALAAGLNAGCLHHVSSVAVAGDHEGMFTEEMFDVGQRLITPYHRTKFEAERLVREQQDVPWRVYRPSVVVGNSETGEMDKIDGPYYLFPAISRLAGLPDVPIVGPDLGDTNVVPVDYVAEALNALVTTKGLDGRAFHLVNPEPQPVVSVYNAFAKAAGAPTISVQLNERVSKGIVNLVKLSEHIPGFTIARDAVMERLGIPPVLLETMAFPSVFSSASTRKALIGSGVEVPRIEDYAPTLWRYWREHLDPFRARKHGPRGELDGRRVIITGASSGIGRATAIKVAAAGGVPLLVARRQQELEEVRDEIIAAGGTASVYPADLTDEESVHKAVDAMLAEHGRIDMLVNNAGRSIRRSIKLSYDRFHDYERAMAINYFGAVRLILAVLPHMSERKFGHIVNVSSIGVQGIAPRFSAYAASKAALDYFSRIAATETHGDGITFTTIHMPLVRTPMIRPTKIYDAFPTKSPDQAADMVMKALRERPKHIGTPAGQAIGLAYTLTPGLTDAVAYQGFRVFPDSAAAGGEGGLKIGKGEQHLSRAAMALARLSRGFHW
ncbi:SDR family oxidoreductase [Amycolatopsis keratiniphila]|uniref:Short chain dehydrogenase n=1 Tax=Amycolatopsis keratiniphila subsp. keratiniphila TaxID=227715 RepID=A0A1W2LIG6_9PSEU|nr:SDR family oxidoreductase [Amycolatopsis keratiniphila]OLZ54122.1 short chain dehydrogenase [Amycolatopsis keratiniphila subsp. nogabecina]ONF62402.1 short chain dehydrogenase [Amycolatopsis keratiniphila subsp. keratiniphila]SDU64077.1 Thioester reductase domain-containing protein [Amycolatopsis keratiniphila]